MQIQNRPQINQKRSYAPKFTSYWQSVGSKLGKPISENNTSFFRTDIEDWNKFTNNLIKKYIDTDKVNIHCFGCSDGVEPFSLAILLIKKLGEKGAKKFFPIIASDIDPKILENPKKGIVFLTDTDLEHIEDNIGKDYSQFIKHDNNFRVDRTYNSDEEICNGQVAQKVRDAIEFKSGDIRNTLSEIPRENTVVMARNFWPYLSDEDQPKLAEALGKHLKKNSMVITGQYDASHRVNAEKLLTQNGFKDSAIRYCYEKPTSEVQEALTNPEFLMNTFANQKKS